MTMGQRPHLILSVLDYQGRLDARFGEGRVVALSYKGRQHTCRHYLPRIDKYVTVKPPRFLSQITKNPEVAAGVDVEQPVRNLREYRRALKEKFGKDQVAVVEYLGWKVKVAHTLVDSGKVVSLTPSKMLRSKLSTLLGLNPSSGRGKTLDQYQSELDAKFGPSEVRAMSYKGSHVQVEHVLSNGLEVLKTPTSLLSKKHETLFVGSKTQYTDAEYKALIFKKTKGTIECTHRYKGSDYTHWFVCLRCSASWSLSSSAVGPTIQLKCPKCDDLRSGGFPKYSHVAIRWMKFMAHRYAIRITHAGSARGEQKVRAGTKLIQVDGLNKKRKLVFEFYGDVFHGNLQVLKPRAKSHPFSTRTNLWHYRKTLVREALLVGAGFRVISIWEATWKDPGKFSLWLRDTDQILLPTKEPIP